LILATSVAISVVFGSGAFLLLQRDLLRVVVGIVLISNAAVLFVMASGLSRGQPPIYPLSGANTNAGGDVSDPLVQAMALTGLIIGSSVTALLLVLVYRLYVSHRSVDMDDISDAEARQAESLERLDDPEGEEPVEEEEADEVQLEREEPR
jgi:multicomponent Na+:H+ antiporter subunit C